MKNKFKILTVLCLFLMLFTNSLFAWVITLSGKGKYGYDYVRQDDGHQTITCRNPGITPCPIQRPVTGQSGQQYSMEEIVNLVDKEVLSNKLNGSTDFKDGIRYSWKATNKTDMEITIVDFTK